MNKQGKHSAKPTDMKRTFIEKLLVVGAWLALVGGILFGTLVSKGIWESSQEMAFPEAVFTFIGSVVGSVGIWAILLEIVSLSDRLRDIEKRLKE
jgi:hypothetical protein